MRNLTSLASLSLLALTTAACEGWNHVETGERGLLEFTPSDCGRENCDLDVPLAIGGATEVRVEAVDDHELGDLTLISSDPYVVDVFLVEDGFYSQDWLIVGYDVGRADIVAIDAYGFEVDYIIVDVRAATSIYLEREAGAADGPTADEAFDEIWTIAAGTRVEFQARPFRAYEGELMGRLEYFVEIDDALARALDPRADLVAGELAFVAPLGDHSITFFAPDGTRLDILFRVQ